MKHSNTEIRDIIFVKIGLNYLAGILNIFWIIYKKMYYFAIIITMLYFFSFCISITTFIILYIMISIILCIFGNKFLIKQLIYVENCKFLGISDGKNIKEARKLFLKEFEKENK